MCVLRLLKASAVIVIPAQFGFLILCKLSAERMEEELRPALFLTLFACGL